MTRAVLPLVALLALVITACGGGSPPPTPRVEAAVAFREEVDGAPQLTSILRIVFRSEVEEAKGREPFASNFELSVPVLTAQGQSVVERLFVTSAQISPDDRHVVLARVPRLIPEGATITIAAKAFVEGAKGDIRATVESDLSQLQVVFASRAFTTARPELVLPGSDPLPVTAETRDPGFVRQALSAHLDRRGSQAEIKASALARYDAIPPDIVTAPSLRAALAALTGTFAESAIDNLLTTANCTGKPAAAIAFQTPPGVATLLARVSFTRDGRRVVSIRPDLEGERLEHLAALLAHEAIHCDRESGRYEEVAATAFDTFLYMQLVAADPELAVGGSPLARDLAVDAIAMVNSGRKFPESVGIFRSPGVTRALPGSTTTVQSFTELVAATYASITNNESPEEPLARAYVVALAQFAGMPLGSAFDLAYVDELLGRAMPPRGLTAFAEAFALVPVP